MHPVHALVEQLGYYGIFLLAVLIQARLCGIRKRIAAVLGLVVLVSILLQPSLHVPYAGIKYLYGDLLTLYKWLTAARLLGVSLWAVWKEKVYSLPLAAGFCVLADYRPHDTPV